MGRHGWKPDGVLAMAKRKIKDTDDLGMIVARGLSTLAYGKRFGLNEAHDVQETFAAIVRAVDLANDLEKRVQTLERETKTTRPKLKVASCCYSR